MGVIPQAAAAEAVQGVAQAVRYRGGIRGRTQSASREAG